MLRKERFVDTRVSLLSVENDYNSLILAALRKLQHVKGYTSVATELSMYFEGAGPLVKSGRAVLESINFNSNTSRYRRTLTYAAMIVDQLSYNDQGANVGTDSFIINFDRLFEDFVIKVLKDVPEKKEFTTWNAKKRFANIVNNSGRYEEREYQPDIVFRYVEEDEKYDYMPSAYAVLDVKNKAYSQFKNADVYQMLTYVRLLHGQKAILIYPSFYNRPPELLQLDASIFTPETISACFINIADKKGEKFLAATRQFADVVLKTIYDIPV